jgi:hypothetical protein
MNAAHSLPPDPKVPDSVRDIARTVGRALICSRDAMNLALRQASTPASRGRPFEEHVLAALADASLAVEKALSDIRMAAE